MRFKEKEKINMTHRFVTDTLEIRSPTEKNPRYIVTGYGGVPNSKDTYGYVHDKDGKVVKSLHSIMTKNAIESMKRQAQYKKVFVDGMHEIGLNTNIKAMLKDRLSDIEMKNIEQMLDTKALPLAKVNNLDIDEKGLKIETELNPLFRQIDDSHKNYFDAVWYSLENKFLNGISPTFVVTDVSYDDDGNPIINDLDLKGFSYVQGAADLNNNIVEVAIRSAQDFTNGGTKMENEELKKIQAELEKVKAEKEAIAKEKETLIQQKAKEEADRKAAEETKTKEEIQKQMDEQKKANEALQKEVELLKQKKDEDSTNSAKGVVTPKDKFGQGQKPKYDEKFYEENIKSIKQAHDQTIQTIKDGKTPSIDNRMAGFGELVNLQVKVDPLAGRDPRDVDFIHESRILKSSTADMVVPRKVA
uniref:Uncharacterized protein n=1 Tax=viral metagenome TaxID=1070528 RepID=A0A6M3KW14_9ZZZZ